MPSRKYPVNIVVFFPPLVLNQLILTDCLKYTEVEPGVEVYIKVIPQSPISLFSPSMVAVPSGSES